MRLAITAAAIVWFAAILIAPFAIGSKNAATAAACVYVTGSYVCHQRPERSFFLAGRQMPVCARCAGLYASAAVASAFAFGFGVISAAFAFRFGGPQPMTGARARWVALVAAMPTIVTWLVEHLGFVHLSNTTRFVAALPLGFAVMWLLLSVVRGSRIEDRFGFLGGPWRCPETILEPRTTILGDMIRRLHGQ